MNISSDSVAASVGTLKLDQRLKLNLMQEGSGNYGPFFVRMAWHSAGTYRSTDGRGGSGKGTLRFAPLNSWPDNGNLDKARRLLWPVKKKYGRKLSWGDLMILTGNVALESMGFQTFGFGGGRADVWSPDDEIFWGRESKWLEADRGGLGDALHKPLGAVQMGLIYVNPQGPGGNPDPLQSAQDIRTTFGRMAMNDVETVALIAGGHTFGKAHGAAPEHHVGAEPEGASIEEQGLGWKNSYKSGKGPDAITSGLEGAWTAQPTKWDNGYFENLFKYEWELTESPAGAKQWTPKDKSDSVKTIPDAHRPGVKHAPMMFTTDIALIKDPKYLEISKRFHEHPDEFADAFARAWYKLTHRDMGPHKLLLGKYVAPAQLWQDPVPATNVAELIVQSDVDMLKGKILENTSVPRAALIRAAWASAVTYRSTDKRGGSNGGRVCLEPQRSWRVNDPEELAATLSELNQVRTEFNGSSGRKVSMADIVVLGGCAAVEEAAAKAGVNITVPFTAGRGDASQEQTDKKSFAYLEPFADGFRNFLTEGSDMTNAYAAGGASPEALLVDRSHMLNLTPPEVCVLVGGMRVLNANAGGSQLGVFTNRPGTLSNDFFVNLLDMGVEWSGMFIFLRFSFQKYFKRLFPLFTTEMTN